MRTIRGMPHRKIEIVYSLLQFTPPEVPRGGAKGTTEVDPHVNGQVGILLKENNNVAKVAKIFINFAAG